MAAAEASEGRNSRSTADELRGYIERLARLEDQKAEFSAMIAEAKTEATERGFDKKALTQMVREHRMGAAERSKQRELEAVCEVYRASLGMLDGTPLGEGARKRLQAEPEPDEDTSEATGEGEAPTSDPPRGAMSQEEIDAARKAGGEAAEAGEKIYANPYVAGDPRRAAWDEGWCQRSGSDGMDIPKAWRRDKAKKPPEDEASPPPDPPEA